MLFETETIGDAKQVIDRFVELARRGPSEEWIFRGMPDLCWRLTTTIQRDAQRHDFPDGDQRWLAFSRWERELIDHFRRRYHQFSPAGPEFDDPLVEWLALMQHFGAPTRLLDWTYSPLIALFFALEEAKSGKDAAVWALRTRDGEGRTVLEEEVTKHLDSRGMSVGDFAHDRRRETALNDLIGNEFTVGKRIPCAFQVNSQMLNERLDIQQGVFLCLGDPLASALDNLEKMNFPGENIRLYIIKSAAHIEVMRFLFRSNITRAVLFPGLEGFARSLKTRPRQQP